LPQSVLERCFEGGALVQVVFDEKTAPGASWCVLWPDLGRENWRSGGLNVDLGGALAGEVVGAGGIFGNFNNKLDK
jgi:hypothetical protein